MTITKASWIKDVNDKKERAWEEFYRNRWQYDKVVRSTHGVNCTGSCSWNIYVKNGIVGWELQATDYPQISSEIPNCEPRGCQRGAAFSWYLYSPLRVKYPYVRGVLLDLWNEARKKHDDTVEAWKSIVENPELRKSYQKARGMGGLRRVKWDDVLEIIAASTIYTIKKHGPDRIAGFSPIPAMSQVSYAAGSRFLQLLGGTVLSFYDWYADLPPASPQIWGEQTDVNESSDWYNAMYTVVMGSNVNMTRTPDAHFLTESRYKGNKVVVLSPDFSQVSKQSDLWIPVKQGEDSAFWLAVNHVILTEFYHKKKTEYFNGYAKKYTDFPFLVELEKEGETYKSGRFLRASSIEGLKSIENSEWKLLIYDGKSSSLKAPKGTIGFRWADKGEEKGKWNLELKDAYDNQEIDPVLTFLGKEDGRINVGFDLFSPAGGKELVREVPVKYFETLEGKKAFTTVFDLLNAQLGINRGLGGDYPQNYDDEKPYTPAWQEKITGVDKNTVIKVAREFAGNADVTKGKSLIIIGAGVNQWYNSDLIYRSCIMALMLTGSVGTNGGGLAHYVGQEKVAPVASWSMLAMALDWNRPPRLQNTPSYWYIHSDQWRYDSSVHDYYKTEGRDKFKEKHTIEFNAKAVRLGWMPFYPQFNKSSIEIVKEARENGCTADEAVKDYIVSKLKSGELKYAIEDPDAEENWPRVWFIWRGNAISSSAKGHEYFLKHLLGTSNSVEAEEKASEALNIVKWREESPKGKFDLIVDLNFRADTSAVYSDIILPTATWYEKNDLNSTDMHSFIHPLSAAVDPLWESKSDWEIFKSVAKKVSEIAEKHFTEPQKDVVSTPLMHDSRDEIAQPSIKDWKYGETEPVPGITMPRLAFVERDYRNLYKKYISLGPLAEKLGIGAHGVNWNVKDEYEEYKRGKKLNDIDGAKYPSIERDLDACEVILLFAPETNGKVAEKSFKKLSESTGIDFYDLVKGNENYKLTFSDLLCQPRRILTSPCWSGINAEGRPYSPFTINTEKMVPWRTLSGRQHFYLDYELFIKAGEALPTYKPKLDPEVLNELGKDNGSLIINYLTPHGKWNIHSTYMDNLIMLTLSRGGEAIWLNDLDSKEYDIADNDWVEVSNKNGVIVCRAIVTARVPRGVGLIYHAPERTVNVPKSEKTGKRGGVHNSVTRVRLKPILMSGGYAQFTYSFNYWGPIGVNRDSYVYVKKLNSVRW